MIKLVTRRKDTPVPTSLVPPAVLRRAQILLATLALLLTFNLLFAGGAWAADGDPTVVTISTASQIAALIGLLIPLAVSLLAKYNAPNSVRAVLNLVLSAAASVLGLLVSPAGDLDWKAFLGAWLAAVVASVSSYYAAWKPFNTADALGAATADFGFGGSKTDDVMEGDDLSVEDALETDPSLTAEEIAALEDPDEAEVFTGEDGPNDPAPDPADNPEVDVLPADEGGQG